MLDGVFVLMSSPISLLLTGLFQLLLCFGVCKAQAELDTIDFVVDIVEILDDLLGDITTLKSSGVSIAILFWLFNLPSKANLLADARIRLAADLGRNSMVRLEMVGEILQIVSGVILPSLRSIPQPHSI